ncbi:hypothetical protein ACVIGB_000982 [Bradyrhizobium sp. USDA 4341]
MEKTTCRNLQALRNKPKRAQTFQGFSVGRLHKSNAAVATSRSFPRDHRILEQKTIEKKQWKTPSRPLAKTDLSGSLALMDAIVAKRQISVADFNQMIESLGDVATEDIAWSESVGLPEDADIFAGEAIWVICCSGMKFDVARIIHERVNGALATGRPVFEVFKHAHKAKAIEAIFNERERLFREFLAAEDKIAYCETLPHIGSITKYHLAKNFGIDCAKPDVHLQRLADLEGTTAQDLCARLAAQTGYRTSTVDLIIWRACATGVFDSFTARFRDKD